MFGGCIEFENPKPKPHAVNPQTSQSSSSTSGALVQGVACRFWFFLLPDVGSSLGFRESGLRELRLKDLGI